MPVQDKIYIGQGVRVRGSLRDPANGEYVDPGSITVTFQRPDGTEVNAVIEQAGSGKYSARTVVDVSGWWNWRMHSEAPGEAAQEGSFKVEPSKFV